MTFLLELSIFGCLIRHFGSMFTIPVDLVQPGGRNGDDWSLDDGCKGSFVDLPNTLA
jgi:hypothetical protein